MRIVEYTECDYCGQSYKGFFYVKNEGEVVCYDCENPVYVTDNLQVEDVEITNDRFLRRIVKDLLSKDIERIFIPRSDKDDETLDFLRTNNGDFDVKKIYFKGNSIDLVLKAHSKAYKCLEYLESGKKGYEDFANTILKDYLNMREYKYSKEEEEEVRDKLESEVMREVELEVMIL